MRHYELTYLVSPDISEEDLKNLIERVNSFVSEQSGLLARAPKTVKSRLGYEIKNKKEAFVITLEFSLKPEGLKNFKVKLDSEGNIIRYIINKKNPLKEVPLKAPKTRETKEKKVELKDIDKKIEEILEE